LNEEEEEEEEEEEKKKEEEKEEGEKKDVEMVVASTVTAGVKRKKGSEVQKGVMDVSEKKQKRVSILPQCVDCGIAMTPLEGCHTCMECGISLCSK